MRSVYLPVFISRFMFSLKAAIFVKLIIKFLLLNAITHQRLEDMFLLPPLRYFKQFF